MYFTVRFYSACKDKMGQGNGTPLQHSCLENPMDAGAWWAAVHGVTKSRTRLSNVTFTFHFHALEKEMATHSSVLAWRIPGMGEPSGLPSMGSHRVGHDWSDLAAAAADVIIVVFLLNTCLWTGVFLKRAFILLFQLICLLFGWVTQHVGSSFPDRGLNPSPLRWTCDFSDGPVVRTVCF